MAWNEPGGGKDPWGNGGNNGGNRGNNGGGNNGGGNNGGGGLYPPGGGGGDDEEMMPIEKRATSGGFGSNYRPFNNLNRFAPATGGNQRFNSFTPGYGPSRSRGRQ